MLTVSSNEVPIAFTLLWSISVCVKVFPKFLQKKKKEIRVDMKINFSCHSHTVSYLPPIFSVHIWTEAPSFDLW